MLQSPPLYRPPELQRVCPEESEKTLGTCGTVFCALSLSLGISAHRGWGGFCTREGCNKGGKLLSNDVRLSYVANKSTLSEVATRAAKASEETKNASPLGLPQIPVTPKLLPNNSILGKLRR
eukprot:3533207-Amphidinium_carterae.1